MYWTYNGYGNDYIPNGFGIKIFGTNLDIKFYALFILVGIIIAAVVAMHECKKLGEDNDALFDGMIGGVICAIIGARLYYVIFEWETYRHDLSRIFRIDEGGLAIHGGLLAAIAFTIIYTKIKKMNLYKTLDYIAPSFLIGQIIGRWGNFFNQEAHGGPTTYNFLKNTLHLPKFIVNNMYFRDAEAGVLHMTYWQPTFLYESTWNLIGLIAILIIRRKKILKLGDLLPIYMIWYSIGRFWIEGMRTDSLMIGSMRQNQVISVVLFIGGIALLVLKRIFRKDLDYYVNYFVSEEETEEVTE